MEDYKELKQLIAELRIDILNYTNNEIETQDLMEHFFKVKEKDPATYELLVLIYNEFQMTHKMNKKQFQAIVDKALCIKAGTLEKMMAERRKTLSFTQRLYNFITWKNITKLFILWTAVLLVLTMLYRFEPDAFRELSNNTFKIFDKIENIKSGGK